MAIALVLAAYLLFSLADSSTKGMVLLSVPVLQIAFVRYCTQLVISASETAYRGIHKSEVSDHFWLLMLRGAMLASATVSNFYALKVLSLSMYSAIMFSVPIIVSLLSWPVLGERVGPWRWFAIVMGFIGVLIIVSPFNENFQWASLFSLYAAFGLAIYSLITRKIVRQVRPHVLQFFTGAFGTVALLPVAIWFWEPVSFKLFLLMAFVGTASWAGHELLTRAHKHADASVLMPYSYSFIIYMSLFGYFLYDELPSEFTLLGAVVIVASGLIIWYRERSIKQGGKEHEST